MRVTVAVSLAFAAAFSASAALADDMFSGVASPLAAAPAQFGGIEFGLDLGGAVGSTGPYATSGFEGGGHVGYNFQYGGFVGGVEGDLLLSNVGGGAGSSSTITTDMLDSLRGRAGYAFGPFLAYATLGGAYSNMSYTNAAGTNNQSITGYVFGLGGEYALMPNISLRAEFRRYLMGEATYYLQTGPQTISTSQSLFLFGVSGHF